MVAGVGAVEQEPPHPGILLYSLARYSRFVAVPQLRYRLYSRCCTVCGIADSIYSCKSGPVVWNSSIGGAATNFTELGAFFGNNFFGLTAIILSLFSNTLATVLVSCKAW